MNSICLVLSLAASFKWEVHQMDVKYVFLHGDLHEEIYREQPIGFIQTDSSLVCRLKKPLYGLKQVPRAWYAKMDSFLLKTGFFRCHYDNTVYTKKVGKSLIILVLYVDDLILTGSDPNLINHVKSSLEKKFEVTDLGHLNYFLGLQVLQSKEGISLSQSKYACDLLRHFRMEDLQKHLLYWLVSLIPIGLVTLMIGSLLQVNMFTLGSGPITWACKKQSVISLSSTKAEYHGVVEASKEALWLHQILSEFGFQQ
eukprot:PITA_27258